ncbi:MAG: hypothetical protein ACR2N4_04515 [Jatrophihabitans sp.]
MRTENDLRLALQDRAAQAPEVSATLIERALADRTTDAIRSRRRARLSIAVAVVIVATLVITPFAITHRADHHPTAPTAPIAVHHGSFSGPLSWATISTADKLTRIMDVGLKLEYIEIDLPDYKEAILTDFAPGAFDISRMQNPRPVTVDGHPGYFGTVQLATDSSQKLRLPIPFGSSWPTLAWQLAANQWVLVQELQLPPVANESRLVALAEQFQVRIRTQPVRMPFKIGYLPGTGWQATKLQVGNSGDIVNDGGEIDLVNGVMKITLSVASTELGPLGGGSRLIGDYEVKIMDSTGVDQSTLTRIQNSVVLASRPHTDNDSWFPITSMLP